MGDLEAELRQASTRIAPSGTEPDNLLPELRRRLARRRQRRAAVIGVMVLALLLGAAALTARRTRESAEPVASTSSTTTTTTTAIVPAAAMGPALAPADVQVPAEGVLVEVPSVGVVLVGLDGRVFGHLPGFTVDNDGISGGPQRLRHGDRWYVLDGGRPAEIDGAVQPLAYGAELVRVGTADPGRFAVRRGGRHLFEAANNMDGIREVSYDRDMVTNVGDGPSEVHDLRTNRTWELPADCWVVDRHGRRHYVLCHERRTVSVADGERLGDPLVQPLDGVGHWRKAMASPDGEDLLLQWSGECDVQSVALVPAAGGPPVRPFGDAMAEAHGWTENGRAVVSVAQQLECGEGADVGIYLVGIDGAKERIYETAGVRVALWFPALR